MCGAANEDALKIEASEFLKAQADTWTARQAPEFAVVNIHSMEIPAPAARIFPELASRDLLAPGAFWKSLLGFRFAVGQIFGWDRAIPAHRPQSFQVGQYFAFFCVKHVDAPREVSMEVENRLTRAVMSWLLSKGAGGTTVFNVTCANFKGRRGRLYWRVIRPFHDGLIEASLRTLRRRVEMD